MNQQFFNKTVWGLILIGVGVLFLLNQTGVVHIEIGSLIADYWPVFLIYLGLKGIFIQRRLEYGWGGSYIWNLFLALLGVYFLFRNLDIEVFEGLDLWQFAVPAILILIGLNMLGRGPGTKQEERKAAMKERRRREKEAYKEQRRHEKTDYKERNNRENDYTRKIEQDLDQAFHDRVVKKMGDDPFPLLSQITPEPNPVQNPEAPTNGNAGSLESGVRTPPPPIAPKQGHSWNPGWQHQGYNGRVVERSNFIGDIHLGHEYWELEPTNVSHFIGDTIIDLTKAHIPYGETKITVSSFIGDVKVFVPNDIQVEVRVTASAFIGDMKVMDRHEGGLFRSMQHDTLHYMEAEKKINLTVSMFIGDVFVKRVG